MQTVRGGMGFLLVAIVASVWKLILNQDKAATAATKFL